MKAGRRLLLVLWYYGCCAIAPVSAAQLCLNEGAYNRTAIAETYCEFSVSAASADDSFKESFSCPAGCWNSCPSGCDDVQQDDYHCHV